MKDQFLGTPNEDATSHLNTFMELCDMQNKKDVDNDVVKMKLFPFSLRDSAKIWFSSLPRNSIDSWNKCKYAFITKYFPPTKIISLRTQILNFKQLEHEHVAQSWESMKMMLRNCPTHWLNLWLIIQKHYAGLNFVFRNLLNSAAMVLLWKLLWEKPPNCLIMSWKIVHNGIPKGLLLVKKLILLKKFLL